ncbi:MAG TPA: 4-carboxymuconolactone decarboxylase [Trueperaceae bacterium]|nr:4-carboxymuconolactone decarboxylase [Trueperaceae bacterium]
MADNSRGDADRASEEPHGSPGSDEDARTRGMRRRRAVLGDEHVDRAQATTTDFDADFQDLITRYAWGEVWQREGLDDRSRHLIVLAMMAALGREEEFAMHVRATRNTGVSEAELAEALHLVAIYAGLPLANGAFKTAKRVLGEESTE